MQEIVEHLVLSEAGVFGNLDELGERIPRSRGFKDRILYLVVMFILRLDTACLDRFDGWAAAGAAVVRPPCGGSDDDD